MNDSLTIGIDVGGTAIKGVVADASGLVLETLRVPTPKLSTKSLLDGISDAISAIADTPAGKRVSNSMTVGVAIAGFLSSDRTQVRYSPNLPLRNTPVKAELEARTSRPIIIENDANAAGLAEFEGARGEINDDAIVLTLGTGIGSAIFVSGELVHGAYGIGGEIGHFRLIAGGQPCHCGQSGCFEQYASATAIFRYAREISEQPGIGEGLARVFGAAESVSGRALTALAEEGDPGALAAVNQTAKYLGEGLASISAILDPGAFILGGGLVDGLGELLLTPTREVFLASLPASDYRPTAKLTVARFGNLAGSVGAASLARASRGDVVG